MRRRSAGLSRSSTWKCFFRGCDALMIKQTRIILNKTRGRGGLPHKAPPCEAPSPQSFIRQSRRSSGYPSLRRGRCCGGRAWWGDPLAARGGGFWGQAPLFGGALAAAMLSGVSSLQQLRHRGRATCTAQGSHQHRAGHWPLAQRHGVTTAQVPGGLGGRPFTVTRPFAISSVARLRVL